jgi:hypothetical protein
MGFASEGKGATPTHAARSEQEMSQEPGALSDPRNLTSIAFRVIDRHDETRSLQNHCAGRRAVNPLATVVGCFELVRANAWTRPEVAFQIV